jgi:hypothetical protein
MITKTFFIMKNFRAQSTNYLRQEKSLRDHGGELGSWNSLAIREHTGHQEHRAATGSLPRVGFAARRVGGGLRPLGAR